MLSTRRKHLMQTIVDIVLVLCLLFTGAYAADSHFRAADMERSASSYAAALASCLNRKTEIRLNADDVIFCRRSI